MSVKQYNNQNKFNVELFGDTTTYYIHNGNDMYNTKNIFYWNINHIGLHKYMFKANEIQKVKLSFQKYKVILLRQC